MTLPSGPAESQIGLEFFYTQDRGIGGKLRSDLEDFVVEEVSVRPQEDGNGENTAVVLRCRGWETNRLVRRIARNLRISRGRVMFAGTKDKRAITTQLFVIAAPMVTVRCLDLRDVDIINLYPTSELLGIGDLLGNKFGVRVRELDIDIGTALETCGSVAGQLEALGGFPNYFGVQRFGAVRPITHLVGKHMTRGEPERAVNLYLCSPGRKEPLEATEARVELAKTLDYARALQNFPKELTFEKAMLNHLVKHPDDHVGALSQLPRNLTMMLVHAYQSYLFNRMLSERMRRDLPLNAPVEGDMVLKMDKNGLPDHDTWLRVNRGNIGHLTDLVGKGKAFVSAPLFGYDTKLAGGEPGDIEAKILEQEDVRARDFVLSEYHKLGSRGKRREILAPVKDLNIAGDGDAVRFDFRLNKGCYATTFLREFMKAGELTKY